MINCGPGGQFLGFMGVLTTLTVGFFSLVIFVADLTNSPDFRADTPASNADLKVTLSMLKKIARLPLSSGTKKVRNSGLGPDPDLSDKSGPE